MHSTRCSKSSCVEVLPRLSCRSRARRSRSQRDLASRAWLAKRSSKLVVGWWVGNLELPLHAPDVIRLHCGWVWVKETMVLHLLQVFVHARRKVLVGWLCGWCVQNRLRWHILVAHLKSCNVGEELGQQLLPRKELCPREL